ncbi:MAG: hypothetical protein ACLGHT_13250 [Acidimicrobiia bacterium]
MREIASRAQRLPLGVIAGAFVIFSSGFVTATLSESMGMGLAVSSLVACALVAIALLAAPSHEVPPPAPRSSESHPRVLRAQLLFADCEPGRVVVDALVLDGASGTRNGLPLRPATPLALEMRMPAAEWFSASIGDLLDEWAEDSQMVDLELLHGALGPRVRMARDEARITLDLTRVDGGPALLALGSA